MSRARARAAGALAAALLVVVLARAGAGSPPKKELPPPPRPDRDFFVANVAPWLEEHCAACHRAGAGTFAMEPPAPGLSDEDRRMKDFARARPFVDAEAPWDSRLLRKVLDPGQGGDPHVGGAFVKDDEEAYDTLLDFCAGATLKNLPPEVYLGADVRAKPGEPVTVDGTGSFDRDRNDVLIYRWELAATPPGSRVALSDVMASRVEIVPDLGGTYVLRLRVSDGKVWSAPRSVAIEVFQHTSIATLAPGAITGLAKVDPRNLQLVRRLYLDVLGRAPTPTEARDEAEQRYADLAANILLRAEAGRVWYEETTLRFGLVGDTRPVSPEATDLPLRLVAEHLVPAAAEAVLARDPAFLRAHPPGRAFAEGLARALLARAPTPEEVAAAERLAAGGPADVPGFGPLADRSAWLEAVLASDGFARAAVRRRLVRFLGKESAERQENAALLATRSGPKAWHAFLEKVLLSAEYRERKRLEKKDDLTLLRGLFVDLLERRPTDRELLALVRAMRVVPGTSAPFTAVVKALIDSGEVPIPLLVDIPDAPLWITDRYLRYVGRKPDAAELAACGEVLLDRDGGPELVVFALLTGPEYACR
jgi:hypothetical protein